MPSLCDSRRRITAARPPLSRSDFRTGFQRAMPFGGVVGAAPLHAEGNRDANLCLRRQFTIAPAKPALSAMRGTQVNAGGSYASGE